MVQQFCLNSPEYKPIKGQSHSVQELNTHERPKQSSQFSQTINSVWHMFSFAGFEYGGGLLISDVVIS